MESNSTSQQHQHQANEILNNLLNSVKTTVTEEKPKNTSTITEVRQLFIGNLPFRVRWQDIKDLFRKAGHVVRADVALNHENRSRGHGTVLFNTVEDAQRAIDMFNNYKWQGRILEVRGDRGYFRIEKNHEDNSSHNNEPSSLTSPIRDKKLVSPSSSKASSPAAGKAKKETAVEKEKVEDRKVDEDKEKGSEDKSKGKVKEGRTKEKIKDEKTKEKANEEKLKDKVKDKVKEKVKVKEEKQEEEDDDCKQLFIGNLPFHCQWQDLKDLFRNSGRILRADVVINFEGRSRGFGTVLFSSHEDAKEAIEQYNGFEFHGRILRVHFDKFAANHARLREHEANTFGQRQIHDPASVELLRQTYLPPQQPQQLPTYPYGLSSYIQPPQPINNYYYGNTNPNTASVTTMPYSSPLNTQQQMPFGNLDMYPSSISNNNRMYPSVNNFDYQYSPSFTATDTTATATNTTNTTATTNNNTTIYTTTYDKNYAIYEYPIQQQPWMQYPLSLQQQQQSMYQPTTTSLSSLSNSLNNLNIHSTALSPESAGLNTNNDNKKNWYQLPNDM